MKRPWNLGLAGLILIGLAYGGWILLRPGPINLILINKLYYFMLPFIKMKILE